MTDEVEEIVEVEAREATETEVFLKEWAKETIKRNIPFLNDVLRSLLTLSTALSGGSMFFMTAGQHTVFRVAAALLFLLAMLACLMGILPYEGQVSFLIPKQIQEHKQKAQQVKLVCVKLAGGLVTLGLVAALLGVVTAR